jgi:methyl-accepting chemotaxis protein
MWSSREDLDQAERTLRAQDATDLTKRLTLPIDVRVKLWQAEGGGQEVEDFVDLVDAAGAEFGRVRENVRELAGLAKNGYKVADLLEQLSDSLDQPKGGA